MPSSIQHIRPAPSIGRSGAGKPVGFATRDLWTLYFLIVLGVGFVAQFTWWLAQPEHRGDPWLFWLLITSLGYKLFFWLYEWYLCLGITVPPRPPVGRKWTVDVFTTACPGEPEEMIIQTLRAMVAMSYPHRNYLCDEGDSPELKRICRELDVIHVTRSERTDAKAGNINNALATSDGEICVILDPDHMPRPDFLDSVLSYFEDEHVGFVQTVQGYHNQSESLIARGAAEQTYMFYGPMMTGMNRWGIVQAIGANCVFRREALRSIGGHAAGLAEDMHTAMSLYALGWKGIYLPEILTRGLVPSTLGSYYKQQLKWSCGCFDLLFRRYPKLWRDFTLSRKIHFLVTPFHYPRGFVSLIDFLIPILCLTFGFIPLCIRPEDFLLHYLPMLLAIQLIRIQAQHWLADSSERGFYAVGGALKTGTWWIYIVGTLSSLFRVKIPYIPTPKGEAATNAWKLALPNIGAAAVSIAAIAYGLNYDWSSYSLLMAGFAGSNALVLIFCAAIGQQRLLGFLGEQLGTALGRLAFLPRVAGAVIARRPTPLVVLILATAASIPILNARAVREVTGRFNNLDLITGTSQAAMMQSPPLEKDARAPMVQPPLGQTTRRDPGSFLMGLYAPDADKGSLPVGYWDAGKKLGTDVRIVPFYQEWGPYSLEHFPDEMLRQVRLHGAVPMITWEPWTRSFPEFKSDPDLSRNRRVFHAILQGKFDPYLRAYAAKLRDCGEPVFLRFAHEMDNPAYPWSQTGGNTPEEYIAAWRYVVNFFKNMGASNVAWVWNPWHPSAVARYFPGAVYFDWFGLTLLNYGGAAQDGNWHGFDQLYLPFQREFAKLGIDKPTMLAEFGSTSYGGDRGKWLGDALTSVATRHPEIRGVVFFHSDRDRNWATPWRPPGNPPFIDWTFIRDDNSLRQVRTAIAQPPFNEPWRVPRRDHLRQDKWPAHYQSPYATGKRGEFELLVDGKPFYVRGVAYNVGQEWRDGYHPMTRRLIDEDLARITAMGANTVRRYGVSIADHNILAAAQDHGLKVLYGFWFEEDVDYLNDHEKLRHYEQLVTETVQKYKDNQAILGWSLGNEVWGLLKHRFAPPYLTEERNAYLDFIEQLARKIHELDHTHPVLMVSEHSWDLPGELFEAARAVPSVDVLGINSYYDPYIRQLDNIVQEYNWFRPYVVSEFGPPGYWDDTYTRFDSHRVAVEPSGKEKATLYAQQWQEYVAGKRGYNVGGVVFTWRDRMEETFTWFGLTDFAGRLKPAYYALRQAWTGEPAPAQALLSRVIGPDEAKPGSVVEFAVSLDGGDRALKEQGLKFQWDIRRDSLFETDARIIASGGGARATVRLPDEPGNYRLYVSLLTPSNAVDTASVNIHVQ